MNPVATESIYSGYIQPSLSQVRGVVLPFLQKVEEVGHALERTYRRIETSTLEGLEKMYGKDVATVAARVLSAIKNVFPEIVGWMMAMSGHLTISLASESLGWVSKFSKTFKSIFLEGDFVKAKQEAHAAWEQTANNCIRGAYLTAVVAGALFMVKGVLTFSFSDLVRGAFFLILGKGEVSKILKQAEDSATSTAGPSGGSGAIPAPVTHGAPSFAGYPGQSAPLDAASTLALQRDQSFIFARGAVVPTPPTFRPTDPSTRDDLLHPTLRTEEDSLAARPAPGPAVATTSAPVVSPAPAPLPVLATTVGSASAPASEPGHTLAAASIPAPAPTAVSAAPSVLVATGVAATPQAIIPA